MSSSSSSKRYVWYFGISMMSEHRSSSECTKVTNFRSRSSGKSKSKSTSESESNANVSDTNGTSTTSTNPWGVKLRKKSKKKSSKKVSKKKSAKYGDYKMGDFVVLDNDREGIIGFIGSLHSKPQNVTFYGIELLNGSAGDSDGVYDGKRYFQTLPNRAIFVTKKKIRRRMTGRDMGSPRRLDRKMSLKFCSWKSIEIHSVFGFNIIFALFFQSEICDDFQCGC